jgi:multidrug resistance efflux pump
METKRTERQMAKHPMTARCELAVLRAEKTLSKARQTRADADAKIRDAEDDLAKAEYDLSINREIDLRRGAA